MTTLSAARIGVMRDETGAPVLAFDGLEGAGYFSVPVPEGQDGRLWKLENAGGPETTHDRAALPGPQ